MAGQKRNRGIPWPDIKRYFIEGKLNADGARYYPTQAEISKEYQVAVGSIAARCLKEQWSVERQILASSIDDLTRAKTAEVISDAGSEFNLACFNAAAMATKILGEKLAIATANDDIDDMNKLSAALKNFQGIGRLALGLSNENTKNTSQVVVSGDITRFGQS